MENYKNNYLNESRTLVIINDITYKIGDIIEGDKLDELSGHNVGKCPECRFVLVKQPLNSFNDNVYNRDNLDATYSSEEDFTKLEKMKKEFEFLPPIPEKGDGLHRIVAAKELGYETILMWKKYELMADLRLVANAMFMKKSEWVNIPDKEKEECFFIFNRYFAKKYPEKSQLLNSKSIDKVIAMDLWYNYNLNKPYPKWFWSKGDPKEKLKVSNPDFKLLLKSLKIREDDLKHLIDNHFDFIKEELKYLKKLEKQ